MISGIIFVLKKTPEIIKQDPRGFSAKTCVYEIFRFIFLTGSACRSKLFQLHP
jgi:hypothetical protein